jgi:hypothetical protein
MRWLIYVGHMDILMIAPLMPEEPMLWNAVLTRLRVPLLI